MATASRNDNSTQAESACAGWPSRVEAGDELDFEELVRVNAALGFPADLREYGLGAQILRYLGVRKMRLLTNNPKKIAGLGGYGLELVDQVPLFTAPNPVNTKYLRTKRDKMGHVLPPLE